MKYLLSVLFSALFIGCFWASFAIPLWEEWPILKTSPWFTVTLLDLYIGLIMFSCFTFLLRKSALHTAIWTILFFSLGNMATLAWVFIYRKDIHEKIT